MEFLTALIILFLVILIFAPFLIWWFITYKAKRSTGLILIGIILILVTVIFAISHFLGGNTLVFAGTNIPFYVVFPIFGIFLIYEGLEFRKKEKKKKS